MIPPDLATFLLLLAVATADPPPSACRREVLEARQTADGTIRLAEAQQCGARICYQRSVLDGRRVIREARFCERPWSP